MSQVRNAWSVSVRGVMALLVFVAIFASARVAQAQSIVGWGSTGFSNIDDLSNITKIAAGGYHTVALKSDGTVA
jgi:hypothetical protein